jgi:hypothetical protein
VDFLFRRGLAGGRVSKNIEKNIIFIKQEKRAKNFFCVERSN